MPEIKVSTSDRQTAQDLSRLIKNEMSRLSPEGRLVLAVELTRLIAPEIKQLQERAKAHEQAKL